MRTIYVNRGEMIEVRFVNDEVDKNAKEWAYQSRPSSVLLKFQDAISIAAADPIFHLVPWNRK